MPSTTYRLSGDWSKYIKMNKLQEIKTFTRACGKLKSLLFTKNIVRTQVQITRFNPKSIPQSCRILKPFSLICPRHLCHSSIASLTFPKDVTIAWFFIVSLQN